MRISRLLLPFMHGVDMRAIEQAILLAKSHEAVLVPLALIRVPEERQARGARLEYLQQSKDFLESVTHKAARHCAPIERLEVFTSDIGQSINLVAGEIDCEGILLFVGGREGILLQSDVIKRLMETTTCKLYIMRLQTNERVSIMQILRQRFSHLLNGRQKQQEVPQQVLEFPKDDVALPIRA